MLKLGPKVTSVTIDSLIWLFNIIGHLFVSSVWLGVDPRTHTKKVCLQIVLIQVLKT